MKSAFYTLCGVFAVVVVGGLIFVFSGQYDVGADSPHWPITRWLVHETMDRSVEARAENIAVPDNLNDPARIAEGGRHYKEMCSECHMAPGLESSELRQGLNPMPPQLAKSAADMSPKEIFWVVKHGVKMTAMPAWGKTHDDQKIWAITAFVKYGLPGMTPSEYAAIKAESDDDEAPGGAQ